MNAGGRLTGCREKLTRNKLGKEGTVSGLPKTSNVQRTHLLESSNMLRKSGIRMLGSYCHALFELFKLMSLFRTAGQREAFSCALMDTRAKLMDNFHVSWRQK